MKEATLPAYPGYRIRDDGAVYVVCAGRNARTTLDKSNGYLKVNVKNAYGKWSTQYVHRLVALAFIPGVDGKLFVDHINGDRTDNRADNLRWCTCKENVTFPLAVQHAVEYRQSDKCREDVRRNALNKSIPVLCLTTGIAFHGVSEAGRAMNIDERDIVYAIRHAKGGKTSMYAFRYMTKEEYEMYQADKKDVVLPGVGRPRDKKGKGMPVLCTDTGEVFHSAKTAARYVGATLQCVARVARGERPTTHGHGFRYITWTEYEEARDRGMDRTYGEVAE